MTLNDSGFSLRKFTALSLTELYQLMQLRNAVFVLEQDCPYLDLDGLDDGALHLFKKADNGDLVAYARILTPEQNNGDYSSIGRVVVAEQVRHEKIGVALMKAAIQACCDHYPEHPLKISAQSYLNQFYVDLGFVSTGNFYLEDLIPHQEMIYQPK